MEGTRITRHELKARWAFSEFRAERWKNEYAALCPEKIRAGEPFSELSPDEVNHLAWMLEQYRSGLVSDLNIAETYECQSWTKEQLGRTFTIVRMAPSRDKNIPFISFIACARFDEESDPRVQADRIPFDTPFVQTEPVIVRPYGHIPILIEGYLRSVLFMRSCNPDATILVWYPVLG